MIKVWCAVCTVCLSGLVISPAAAFVDLANANFTDPWVLLDEGGKTVRLTYNSRTRFQGLFGLGWCSEFETTLHLDLAEMGDLKGGALTLCGAGAKIAFDPDGVGQEGSCMDCPAMHARLERRGATWRVLGLPVADGHMDFNAAGVLIGGRGWVSLESHWMGDYVIEYTAGTPSGVSFEDGSKLELKTNTQGLTTHVQLDGGNAEIWYDAGLMRRVRNGWGNHYEYDYDKAYNLSRIGFPDGTEKLIIYDIERDWVVRFHHRDGCVEDYSYSQGLSSGDNNVHAALLTKSCGGKIEFSNYFYVSSWGANELLVIDNGGVLSWVVRGAGMESRRFGGWLLLSRDGVPVEWFE